MYAIVGKHGARERVWCARSADSLLLDASCVPRVIDQGPGGGPQPPQRPQAPTQDDMSGCAPSVRPKPSLRRRVHGEAGRGDSGVREGDATEGASVRGFAVLDAPGAH